MGALPSTIRAKAYSHRSKRFRRFCSFSHESVLLKTHALYQWLTLVDADFVVRVCTENLNPNVLTMKSAQYGARIYDAGSLNLARDRRMLALTRLEKLLIGARNNQSSGRRANDRHSL